MYKSFIVRKILNNIYLLIEYYDNFAIFPPSDYINRLL